ncbi:MAG: hypothetical protein IT307_00370 [Chloroflexi bacterium]|nr:hypothetical protein [Chloroflexota bacterium]
MLGRPGTALAGAFTWVLDDIENAYDGREGSFGLFNERLNREPNAAVWHAAAARQPGPWPKGRRRAPPRQSLHSPAEDATMRHVRARRGLPFAP